MKGKGRDIKKKKVNNEGKESATEVVRAEATKTSKADKCAMFSVPVRM